MSGRWSQRPLSRIAAPMLLWALHFAVLYALQGLVCARGWPQPPAVAAMVVLTLLAIAVLAATAARAWPPARARDPEDAPGRFAARVVLVLSLLAMVAVSFTAMPLLLLAPCR